MKKTIPTSIANTLFHIEEDAYHELDAYLTSIRTHFAKDPDSAEIVRDIESRIAEQFIECSGGAGAQSRIITQEHVAKLIASMGRPSDFGDEAAEGGAEPSAAPDGKKPLRKLYRDPDNAVVAGVSAGLGHYFGIDPVLIRVIFLVTLAFGGAGVLIYLILWAAMPEAKTPGQKLEMRGEPVTLQSIGEFVNEKLEEVKVRGGGKQAAAQVESVFRTGLRTIAHNILPVVRNIVGGIVTFGGIVGMTFAVGGLSVAMANRHILFADFPLEQVIPGLWYYAAILAIFFFVAIPLAFIASAGTLIAGGRPMLAGRIGAVFLGLWFVAIMTGIVTTSIIYQAYREVEASDPRYQPAVRTASLDPFTAIEAKDGQRITLVTGKDFSLRLSGKEIALDRVEVQVRDGVLMVGMKKERTACLFCAPSTVEIQITAPEVASLRADDGTRIVAEKLQAEALTLAADDGSRIDIAGSFGSVTLVAENGARIALSGTARTLKADLRNGSRLESSALLVQAAEVRAMNASRAEVNVEETLQGRLENGSRLDQSGEAGVDQIVADRFSSVNGPGMENATDGETPMAPEVPLAP